MAACVGEIPRAISAIDGLKVSLVPAAFQNLDAGSTRDETTEVLAGGLSVSL